MPWWWRHQTAGEGGGPGTAGSRRLWALCGLVATTKSQVPKWMWELQLDPVGSGSWPLGTGPRCAPGSGLRVIPCVLLTLGVQVATLIWSLLGPWTVTIGSPGKGASSSLEPGSTAQDQGTQHHRNLFIWQIRLIKSFFPINCASFTHIQVTNMSQVF